MHDAIDAVAELAVTGKAGRRREPIPDGIGAVAARRLEAEIAGQKSPSLGQLRSLARRHGLEISKPGIRDWLEGDQWRSRGAELLSLVLTKMLDEDDRQEQQLRQQEYDAKLNAITRPKDDSP